MNFLLAHSEIDLLGGAILERIEGGETRRRVVPQSHSEIVRWSRWRNPMNHMTTFFKTAAFRRCHGYPDIPYKEDYALWLKMIASGATLANLPDDLVLVNVTSDQIRRRSGLKNLRSEYELYKLKKEVEGIENPIALFSLVARATALSFRWNLPILYTYILR